MSNFLDLALDAVRRGFKVEPLQPRSKKPLTDPNGARFSASDDEGVVRGWAQQFPDANCALVASEKTWTLDADNRTWFVDNAPFLPDTFVVKTGGGGLQLHFLQDAASLAVLKNRALPNPNFVSKEKTPDETTNLLEIKAKGPYYGIMAGSVHPSGNIYKTFQDRPLIAAPKEFLDWVVQRVFRDASKQRALTPMRTKDGWDPEKALAEAGLKFDRFEQDGKVWFAYHVKMGKCLVKGARHESTGNRDNNRCCAFLWNPKTRDLGHWCFACGEVVGQKRTALAALGLKLSDVFEKPDSNDGTRVELVPATAIRPEHLRYLWQGYLPHKLTHFVGASTEGKSPVTLDIVARLTTGRDWPDGTANGRPRSAVVLAAEDDPADTVIPRLMLAGADMQRVFFAKCTLVKGQTATDKMLSLKDDVDKLTAEMREVPDLGMVVIDPITNYLGAMSMNKEEEVRSVLMPLSLLAADMGIAVVTVGHLNKREKGTDPLQRIMGAAAFVGVARFIYIFGPDDDALDKYAHVMIQQRGVGAKGLRYKTFSRRLEWDNQASDVVGIEWTGFTDADASEAVDAGGKGATSKIKKAAAVMREFLKDGKKSSHECKERLKEDGFDPEQVSFSRVMKAAGAKTNSEGKGLSRTQWWFMPAKEPDDRQGGMDF